MQKDLFGNTRYKINLHTHTTLSDGHATPEEALRIYRENGYDAIALTDHWYYGKSGEADGITILSGAEYNIGGSDSRNGVFHILGIGAEREPSLTKTMSAQQIIDRIHEAGGLAILAHPAWSLNTPEQVLPLQGFDATEIYNSVSGVHHSRRADSSLIVDMLASAGRYYWLIADDDVHYYDSDKCLSWIMAKAENNSAKALLEAIRNGDFYATQGPEVHLIREGDSFSVKCSPCSEIVFLSNFVWRPRVFEGDGLTEAHYQPVAGERFLRAMVTDANGKQAWTNIITL
ncbi:MAG: hypothetical protein IJW92_07105 [Clostridia bacterium]|nr:hypothetical protein [Clostridia bacterium]